MLTPTQDRILIDPTPIEEQTAAGIILSQSDTNTEPTSGTVIAVGRFGRWGQDNFIPVECEVGDVVMWSKFAGRWVEDNGKKYILMRDTDVCAIIQHATAEDTIISEISSEEGGVSGGE